MRGYIKQRILAQVLALLCEGGKEQVKYSAGMSIGSKLIFLVKCCYFFRSVLCLALSLVCAELFKYKEPLSIPKACFEFEELRNVNRITLRPYLRAVGGHGSYLLVNGQRRMF